MDVSIEVKTFLVFSIRRWILRIDSYQPMLNRLERTEPIIAIRRCRLKGALVIEEFLEKL